MGNVGNGNMWMISRKWKRVERNVANSGSNGKYE
jgi:hypothetical protein